MKLMLKFGKGDLHFGLLDYYLHHFHFHTQTQFCYLHSGPIIFLPSFGKPISLCSFCHPGSYLCDLNPRHFHLNLFKRPSSTFPPTSSSPRQMCGSQGNEVEVHPGSYHCWASALLISFTGV